MQKKALILLFLALVMGGVAVVLVNLLLQQEGVQQSEVEAVPMTKVVVASVELKMGTRLSSLSIKEVDMPVDNLPKGVFHSVSELVPEGDEQARMAPVVLERIVENEIILPYKLSPHGARTGLPRKIPEDMRAFTIEVSEVSGVAGFVLPGNYVDVLLTSTIGRTDKNPATRTLLQNVEVLGIDQISSEDEDNPQVVNAVTLLVTPKEGKMLALGDKVGELNLLLRNEFDASIVNQEIVSITTLLEAYKERKPVVYRRERRPTVEIIRGLDVEKRTVREGAPAAPDQPAQ